jgi:hypothetical protein
MKRGIIYCEVLDSTKKLSNLIPRKQAKENLNRVIELTIGYNIES